LFPISRLLLLDKQALFGIFPTDRPLWSIFVELVASLAFIPLIQFKQPVIYRLCFLSLALIGVGALLRASANHVFFLPTDVGVNASSFIGGFPRVMYGFLCGMLLYHSRSWTPSIPVFNALVKSFPFNVIFLYLILIGSLIFSLTLYGLYYFVFISLLAPLLVVLGSKVSLKSPIVSSLSAFLGWISYPIYCLHEPILFGLSLNHRLGFASAMRVPCKAVALVATLIIATITAFLIEHFKMQQKLSVQLRKALAVLFPA
jgi:peptidoglycan/LPS O-acetylase OafA/YrhL